MSITHPRRQRGFAIIAAIVILVILAGLAGFVVSLSTSQNITLAQDVQGARAYQAARAGVEYGLARWLSTNPSVSTNCPTVSGQAVSELGFSFDLTGTHTTSSGIGFCELTATARPTGMTSANAGSIGYIERQIRVVAEGNH